MNALRFLVIGTPGCPRITAFQAALVALGHPPATVVSYVDLIEGNVSLRSLTGVIVRIESPGRDAVVFRKILAFGVPEMEMLGLEPAKDLTGYSQGEIIQPHQWYLGFRRCLRRISSMMQGAHSITMLSNPSDVETIFCKSATHKRFSDAGVPVPACLGKVEDFTELMARMERTRYRRVFVKLEYGSAASGLLALAYSGRKIVAYSTVEVVHNANEFRLFNTRRIRRFSQRSDIAKIVDALCPYGVHVEEWIPKIGVEGYTCDIRSVVINRHPTHWVLRKSKGPFTNLHLKNKRDVVTPLVNLIGQEKWKDVVAVCQQAATCFSGLYSLGLDIAISSTTHKPFILEGNAFGDFVKDGVTGNVAPYEMQLSELIHSET